MINDMTADEECNPEIDHQGENVVVKGGRVAHPMLEAITLPALFSKQQQVTREKT